MTKKLKIVAMMMVLAAFALYAAPQLRFAAGLAQTKSATAVQVSAMTPFAEFSLEGGFPLIRKVYSPGPDIYAAGRMESSRMSMDEIWESPVVSATLLFTVCHADYGKTSAGFDAGLSADAVVDLGRTFGKLAAVGSYGIAFRFYMMFGRNFRFSYQGTVPAANLIGMTKRQDLEQWEYWALGPVDRTSDRYVQMKDLAWYSNMRLSFTYVF